MSKICAIIWTIVSALAIACQAQDIGYDVYEVELANGDRIVTTSDQTHYALASDSFGQPWRTVSVNEEDVLIVDSDGQIIQTTTTTLSEPELQSIEVVRHRFDPVLVNVAPQTHWVTGYDYGWPIPSPDAGVVRVVGYPRCGGIVAMGARPEDPEMNILYEDDGVYYGVSRSDDDFIYAVPEPDNNWDRIIVEDDLVMVVTHEPEVYAMPWTSMDEIHQQLIGRMRDSCFLRARLRSQTPGLCHQPPMARYNILPPPPPPPPPPPAYYY